MNASAPDEVEDHGQDLGPAAQARPSRMDRVGGTYRGAGQRVANPIYAKRLLDAHLIDRMHYAAQLNDVQFKTAHRVLEMHGDAGFEPNVTSGYCPPGWNQGHDDDSEEAPAIGRFRQLLGGCSRAAADILHGMCLEQHPGVWRLASLQAALDDLARKWGLG